jgi:hypothetical protein
VAGGCEEKKSDLRLTINDLRFEILDDGYQMFDVKCLM